MNAENRGHLYLLTGLLLGAALGLAYAWLVNPVEYVDTEPASMAQPYKEAYRVVIAQAYRARGDLGRARERMRLIDGADSVRVLAAQSQRMIAANAPAADARALSVLASDLSQPVEVPTAAQIPTLTPSPQTSLQPSPSVTGTIPATPSTEASPQAPAPTTDPGQAVRTATLPQPTLSLTPPPSPTPTLTRMPTFTPPPSATPRLYADAPFALASQERVCDGSIPAGMVQVEVADAQGRALPGVRIQVTWQDGESVFFTGLAPDISPGYADFVMAPGVEYNVNVGDASEQAEPVSSTGGCGWRLEYNQE